MNARLHWAAIAQVAEVAVKRYGAQWTGRLASRHAQLAIEDDVEVRRHCLGAPRLLMPLRRLPSHRFWHLGDARVMRVAAQFAGERLKLGMTEIRLAHRLAQLVMQ